MEFYFERMNFDDSYTIANYGQEVLDELQRIKEENSNIIMNANIRDTELEQLIESIPKSIDIQIKNITEESSLPAHLIVADKVIDSKLTSWMIPGFIKKAATKKIQEHEIESDDNFNSVTIYNNTMDTVDRIKDKLINEHVELKSVYDALEATKQQLSELSMKFDIVIQTGMEDLETYENSDVNPELKQSRKNLANRRLNSLRKSKNVLDGFIQQKELSKDNILLYIVNIKEWLDTGYLLLGSAVDSGIESAYIENKVDTLGSLNKVSNEVITNSSKKLKNATTKNTKMLQEGSIKTETINTLLKDINESLTPILQLSESAGRDVARITGDIEKIEKQLDENRKIISSINEGSGIPQLSDGNENQKVKKLGAKTINNG